MRTIVVGDMHQKQHLVLPIVDNAIRFLGAKRVVLLGDYCDDYSPTGTRPTPKSCSEGWNTRWIGSTARATAAYR